MSKKFKIISIILSILIIIFGTIAILLAVFNDRITVSYKNNENQQIKKELSKSDILWFSKNTVDGKANYRGYQIESISKDRVTYKYYYFYADPFSENLYFTFRTNPLINSVNEDEFFEIKGNKITIKESDDFTFYLIQENDTLLKQIEENNEDVGDKARFYFASFDSSLKDIVNI